MKGKRKALPIIILSLLVFAMAIVCLFAGSSGMSIEEGFRALFGEGSAANIRIMQKIRLPRVLASLIAGAGLSLAGLMMQTVLGNSMASPSTLGVTNAAVFGANLSIIAFAGGFLDTGNHLASYTSSSSPFSTGLMAFIFSLAAILVIMGLCRLRSFSPSVVVLSGIALGSVFSAATSILQFYATDVGLSAAVIWNFGDLGRANYTTDLIMAVTLLVGIVFFSLMSWRYNALLSGDSAATAVGVNVKALRFLTLLMASVITAVCVSFLGIIGFVGVICPHIAKRIIGQDHRISIPASALTGSLLLLVADTFSRTVASGSALPVGAVTSLLGAPFFIALIIGKRGRHNA